MTLNFPSSPAVNDVYVAEGARYVWDGEAWYLPPNVPAGIIAIWAGSVASIPTGWALCDGTNGTPNLRNRFVVGAGDTYDVGDTGGQNAITAVPAHSHGSGTLAAASGGAHSHTGNAASGGAHQHNVPVFQSGSGTSGTVPAAQINFTNTISSARAVDSAGAHTHTLTIDSGGAHTHNITGNTASAGSASVDTRPPYYALAYIMKL